MRPTSQQIRERKTEGRERERAKLNILEGA